MNSLKELIDNCYLVDIFLTSATTQVFEHYKKIETLLSEKTAKIEFTSKASSQHFEALFLCSLKVAYAIVKELPDKKKKDLCSISCEFQAVYVLAERYKDKKISKTLVEKFAVEVAAFSLYAYSRSHIQDALAKANLRVPPLPLLVNRAELRVSRS